MGGRKQRSVLDTALLLVHHNEVTGAEVKRWKRSRLITSTVFLDIKGVFYYVDKGRLTEILTILGFRKFIQWVYSFTTGRSVNLSGCGGGGVLK